MTIVSSAFKWCNNKNVNGITGWYLPSITEIELIIRLYETLNEGLLNNGGVVITTTIGVGYWSSSECSSSMEYAYQFYHQHSSTGFPNWTFTIYKQSSSRIRAVHSF